MPDNTEHPYAKLVPEVVLDAVDATGLLTSGRILALNSYENRVYQVGIEDQRPVVVKFYRPGRWTDPCILEEHSFTWNLAEKEVPVVAPIRDESGRTLHHFAGFSYAVFPSVGGRAPELDDLDHLEWLGRYMGRIHHGAPFKHRPWLTIERFVSAPAAYLLDNDFIPGTWRDAYRQVISDIVAAAHAAFERAGDIQPVRLHGDCHPGNILWMDSGPNFLDFDDIMTGPAVQDLWMLISGERGEMALQLSTILEGYEEFADFNRRELHLIESLRAMRMVHYAGWLGKRWHDPAFPMNFPWFGSEKYWEQHIHSLLEQLTNMAQPPLVV